MFVGKLPLTRKIFRRSRNMLVRNLQANACSTSPNMFDFLSGLLKYNNLNMWCFLAVLWYRAKYHQKHHHKCTPRSASYGKVFWQFGCPWIPNITERVKLRLSASGGRFSHSRRKDFAVSAEGFKGLFSAWYNASRILPPGLQNLPPMADIAAGALANIVQNELPKTTHVWCSNF